MSAVETPYLTDAAKKKHLLNQPIVRIGRGSDQEIVIASKRVSREHAVIRQVGNLLYLEDLRSANGTFLNDERVLQSMRIRDGDRISTAGVMFYFHDPETTIRENPFPELEIDMGGAVVRVDRQVIELSPKEFALLIYLFDRLGEACSKDAISKAVWPEYPEDVYDYQIENLVRRVRAKIERNPGSPQLLQTVRGRGYKLVGRAD